MLTVALFVITSSSIDGVRKLTGMAKVAEKHARAGEILHGFEKRLRGAFGFKPTAWVVEELLQGDATLVAVDSLRGFPDAGTLELGAGTADAERIRYERVAETEDYRAFEDLDRAETSHRHSVGTAVRWRSFGEVLPGTPEAGTFDGISATPSGPVHFRGDATGFCFQRSVVVDGERVPGAVLGASAVADAWHALYFEPASRLDEAERGVDLNRDGDRTDVFDLGRLRLRSWTPPGPNASFDDIVVSPSAVVQERGAWGRADLDGDGAADPLFLWHEDVAKLQVQLVLWTGARGSAGRLTKIESALRLERAR